MNTSHRPVKNGFATKADLRSLEQRIGRRFVRVEGKFDKIEGKVDSVESKFAWLRDQIKIELDHFKTETFSAFNSRWISLIDPILKEIEYHRQKEVLWAEQNRRTEEKVDSLEKNVTGLKEDVTGLKEDVTGLKEDVTGLKENVTGLKENVTGLKENVSTLTGTVLRIAKKVGA